MQGKNELILNSETACEAIKFWLDNAVFRYGAPSVVVNYIVAMDNKYKIGFTPEPEKKPAK